MTRTAADWRERAKTLQIEGRAFIDGVYRPALSGKTFASINPATGETLAQVAACEAEDIDLAVKAARAAFEDGRWSDLHPAERGKRLMRFADLVAAHSEEFALLETLDCGKPIRDSRAIDIPGVIRCIHWYGEAADKLMHEIAPTDPSALALVSREPLGVVAAVVPWNFPLLMATWKLAPALAAGNSVIIKPAEQSPLSAIRLAALASEAGIPDGVFNVVPGFGETAGEAIGLHMDIDAVAFTGSTEVGKLFLQYAGRSNMKQVSLECGGKSPHIVMADAPDLDKAAAAAASAIFFNQGEVCTAGSRLLVDRAIRDDFLERLLRASAAHRLGDPLDPETSMGALIDGAQQDRVLGHIARAEDEGARRLLGGGKGPLNRGFYVEPTIFDQVTPEMSLAREEVFGPVLAVLDFKDEEEAIRIANDTIYGLAAGLWSRDISRAHRMARAVRAGTVWVNCWDPTGDMTIPFGGFKQSGFGRDKSLHALEKYSQLKTSWFQL